MFGVPTAVIVASAVLQVFAYYLLLNVRAFAYERIPAEMPMRTFEVVGRLSLMARTAFFLGFGIFFWIQCGLLKLVLLAVSSFVLSLVFQSVIVVAAPGRRIIPLMSALSFVVMPIAALVMIAASS